MSQIWFTSDTHWRHVRIIEYQKRPFASVREMDETMIANWNAVVAPEDTVYHNGDVALGKPLKRNLDDILYRLNGTLHLTIGNHDDEEIITHPRWASVAHYREIRMAGRLVVLSHYAMRVWNKSGPRRDRKTGIVRRPGSIMLYGHSHSNLPGNSQSLDIGVDYWNFTPITFAQIEKRLRTLPTYTGYAVQAGGTDHHGSKDDPDE